MLGHTTHARVYKCDASRFTNDQIGIKVEEGSRLVKVHDNHFSPPSAVTVESRDPKAVIADQEPSQQVH